MIKFNLETFKEVFMYSFYDFFKPLKVIHESVTPILAPIKMLPVLDYNSEPIENQWYSSCGKYYMHLNSYDYGFPEAAPHYVIRDYKTAKVIVDSYGTFEEALSELEGKVAIG